MTATITYPFDNPSNYVASDANKIEVAGGSGVLKLNDNPGQSFSQDFSSDAGFTYDSVLAEFLAGTLQQIDTRPADSTFYAPYTNDINGAWGDGVLTGSGSGGAAVSGGALDLSFDDTRYVDYDADLNSDSQQVGCIRLRVEPNWSGNPASDQYFVNISENPSTNVNGIAIYASTLGRINVRISSSTGSTIVTFFDTWLPTAGTVYEIELNYDITTGETRLFIDGIQAGATGTATGTRSSSINLFRVGSDVFAGQTSNFKVHDILVFDTVQHTTNYTPDWSDIFDTIYVESKIEMPQFAYSGAGSIQAFTNLTTSETNAPRQIWNDLYWNGAAWVSSDGSFAQANVVADILANIASFPISATLDVDIVFESGSTQMSISQFDATYTGQEYATDNPTLEIAQGFRIEELISFVESVTKSGSDEVKYILKKDSDWYYWSGSAWAVSNETYAQSNTAAEITTNIASFVATAVDFNVRIFLHSDDGSTTPSIENLVITYDFAGDQQDDINVSTVYWYSRKSDGTVCTDEVTAKLSAFNVRYKDNIFVCQEEITATPDAVTGYIELPLIENVNMVDSNGGAVTYLLLKGGKQFANISVPENSGSLLWDILA